MRDGGGRTSSLRTGVRERAAHLAEQSAQWFSTKHPQLGAGVKRRCRLRYLHTRHSRFLSFRFEKKRSFSVFVVCCYCYPADLQPPVTRYFTQPSPSDDFLCQIRAVPHTGYPTGLFPADLQPHVKAADSLWHTSPLVSGVTFHPYFILAPHPRRVHVG